MEKSTTGKRRLNEKVFFRCSYILILFSLMLSEINARRLLVSGHTGFIGDREWEVLRKRRKMIEIEDIMSS